MRSRQNTVKNFKTDNFGVKYMMNIITVPFNEAKEIFMDIIKNFIINKKIIY